MAVIKAIIQTKTNVFIWIFVLIYILIHIYFFMTDVIRIRTFAEFLCFTYEEYHIEFKEHLVSC